MAHLAGAVTPQTVIPTATAANADPIPYLIQTGALTVAPVSLSEFRATSDSLMQK